MREKHMIKIFATNLFVPVLVILAIAAIAGSFRFKKKESIKGEVYEYFVKVWKTGEPESGEETFFQRFFRMFIQAYEYEKYKESVNKLKYYLYKILVLSVILSIPFLVLFLITEKDWILNNGEWNDIYLYTLILVPLIFAYLIHKYIRIRKYHETWYRHLRNRHEIEWRMLVFIKDYEQLKAGMKPEDTVTIESLKMDFINDLCEYWKTAADVPLSDGSKEDSIFAEIGSLFGKE